MFICLLFGNYGYQQTMRDINYEIHGHGKTSFQSIINAIS